MEKRVRVTAFCFLGLLLLVIARLGSISFLSGDELRAMAEAQHTSSMDYYQYARGDFLDTFGRPLTGDIENCIVIYPSMLDDKDTAAEIIAEALSYDKARITERINYANGAGKPYILKTAISREQADMISDAHINGVLCLPMAARYGDSRTALNLLGELLPDESGTGYHGASGLEAQYDDYLNERKDKQILAYIDATGNFSKEDMYIYQPEPVVCNNVELTIDMDLQQIAQAALADHSGAAVILDVENGDILAAASAPTYDPYGWQPLPSQDVYVNKAFASYPPASTFKIVLTAAALETGTLPIDESGAQGDAVYCDGAYSLTEGYDVACWNKEGHGETDLAKALADSCNCYYIGLGRALGGDIIAEYAERFGLASQSIIGYALVDSEHIFFSRIGEGSIANASIGENGIRISPLQSAVMAAACANGGYRITPRLVKSVKDASGNPLLVLGSEPKQQAIDEETAETLRTLLRNTVEWGTGVNAESSYLPCAGKTGTSEDEGVWFCGFAPLDTPKWAVSVYIEDGSSGSIEPALIFREIVDRIAILKGLD